MAIRVSQIPVETLLLPNPNVRVSQIPVETLTLPTTAKMRTSQLPIEVLYSLSNIGNIRVSQYPIEIMLSNTLVPTRRKYGPAVQCI
jgi:hypothetical protein